MYFLFTKKDSTHQIEKNTNKIAGFLFGKFYFTTGNKSMIKEALNQLDITAYGKI